MLIDASAGLAGDGAAPSRSQHWRALRQHGQLPRRRVRAGAEYGGRSGDQVRMRFPDPGQAQGQLDDFFFGLDHRAGVTIAIKIRN